jgi:hypothetical protein
MKKWDEIKDKKFTAEQIEDLNKHVQEELNAMTNASVQMRLHINECHNLLRELLVLHGKYSEDKTVNSIYEWAEKLIQWQVK